ncbi:MarR family transcriptional regulator [Actinocorallia sp. API 0066]|uniref:MarR family winged helix-turn-helix transcriptional regulator n=1 Tax=Actinocorallia sp. API 0066 TaxID=2896846 RepID=UPI001E4DB101|nr:MarR family transcriptional regulator [Actinocorallia sp. API 0066]MCD0451450.1 MarR family transcriptional regulator [Actinocorallia sp. API 0066]
MDSGDDALIREFGLLLSAASRLERIAGRAFERRVGISHVMFEVLLRLDEGCVSMSHMAKDMILTSGGMTRLIDRMERAGLLTRHTSETDRRVQKASLTAKGRETLTLARAVHTETLREFFAAPLTPTDRATLQALLERLESRGRQELPSLG